MMIVVAFIMISKIKKEQQTRRNEEYEKEYPQKINEYLQEKYGKTFDVNPDYFFTSGSPIPFAKVHSPFRFEVWEEVNDGYVFNVWIHTESYDDKKIKNIDDNYCWKFFNMKLKTWFENELYKVLPQEYKFASCFSPKIKFAESVRPDSPLEYFFETKKYKIQLMFYLIIPPDDITQNMGILEEDVENAVNEFYEKYPNSRIVFYVVQTKDIIDYNFINVQELENTDFYLGKESVSIWDIEDIEVKVRIEVGGL